MSMGPSKVGGGTSEFRAPWVYAFLGDFESFKTIKAIITFFTPTPLRTPYMAYIGPLGQGGGPKRMIALKVIIVEF